jgi:hypothetical protein
MAFRNKTDSYRRTETAAKRSDAASHRNSTAKKNDRRRIEKKECIHGKIISMVFGR